MIIVPGIGTGPSSAWFEGKGKNWQSLLPEDVLPAPAVYQFDHDLDSNMNANIWTEILNRGFELLEALLILFKSRTEVRVLDDERKNMLR